VKKAPLNVFVDRAAVGQLTRSDVEADTVLFGYRDEVSAQRAVSLTMPVRVDQYDAMGGLLPIFEMNLPEGALRARLRLQFAKAIPEFDDLDLLGIVGSSQIGRLRYSRNDQLDEAMPDQSLDELLTYKGSADLFAHLLERFATYSGVSGVQPKVLIREIQPPAKVTHAGATHIVKTFNATEFPELAANELLCTQGAMAAGIKTANLRISEDRKLLVVDRFDVSPGGIYLGVEDFCVLEALRAHGRYDGSYEGIGKRITDFVSPAGLATAREQYVLQVAYACAIGNGDAHLKNFAVLYRHPEDPVELAPAYDVVSTLPYIPRDSMALTMDGSKAFPDRARLITFIRQVTGKSERSAAAVLEQVAAGVAAAIANAAEYGRKHSDATAFVERLCAVLGEGQRRLK
jgi:serine/threonine-protein kinase HipA